MLRRWFGSKSGDKPLVADGAVTRGAADERLAAKERECRALRARVDELTAQLELFAPAVYRQRCAATFFARQLTALLRDEEHMRGVRLPSGIVAIIVQLASDAVTEPVTVLSVANAASAEWVDRFGAQLETWFVLPKTFNDYRVEVAALRCVDAVTGVVRPPRLRLDAIDCLVGVRSDPGGADQKHYAVTAFLDAALADLIVLMSNRLAILSPWAGSRVFELRLRPSRGRVAWCCTLSPDLYSQYCASRSVHQPLHRDRLTLTVELRHFTALGSGASGRCFLKPTCISLGI